MEFNEYTLESQHLIPNEKRSCNELLCGVITASVVVIGVAITVIFIIF